MQIHSLHCSFIFRSLVELFYLWPILRFQFLLHYFLFKRCWGLQISAFINLLFFYECSEFDILQWVVSEKMQRKTFFLNLPIHKTNKKQYKTKQKGPDPKQLKITCLSNVFHMFITNTDRRDLVIFVRWWYSFVIFSMSRPKNWQKTWFLTKLKIQTEITMIEKKIRANVPVREICESTTKLLFSRLRWVPHW